MEAALAALAAPAAGPAAAAPAPPRATVGRGPERAALRAALADAEAGRGTMVAVAGEQATADCIVDVQEVVLAGYDASNRYCAAARQALDALVKDAP